MGKFTYGNKSSQEFKRNQFYRKRKSDDFRPYTGGRRNDKSNDSSVNIGRDNNTKYHGYSNNEGMGKYQQSGGSDNFTRDQDNNRRNKSDNNNYDRFERKNNMLDFLVTNWGKLVIE